LEHITSDVRDVKMWSRLESLWLLQSCGTVVDMHSSSRLN